MPGHDGQHFGELGLAVALQEQAVPRHGLERCLRSGAMRFQPGCGEGQPEAQGLQLLGRLGAAGVGVEHGFREGTRCPEQGQEGPPGPDRMEGHRAAQVPSQAQLGAQGRRLGAAIGILPAEVQATFPHARRMGAQQGLQAQLPAGCGFRHEPGMQAQHGNHPRVRRRLRQDAPPVRLSGPADNPPPHPLGRGASEVAVSIEERVHGGRS